MLADGTYTYLRVAGQGRIAQFDGAEFEYFLGDALGSVRQLADENGEVVLAQSYEPFGEQLTSAGNASTTYGFAAEYLDLVTGLIYLRARFMMPGLGRFLTRDTFPGFYERPASLNPFTYAENNAVNYTDPSGHFIDTLLDIGFTVYDVYVLADRWQKGCDLTWDWIALGADVAGLVIPGVTGLGLVTRGDDALRLLQATRYLDNAPEVKRILVVGESSFDYTRSLYNRLVREGSSFHLTATSLDTAQRIVNQGFSIPSEAADLAIRHRVGCNQPSRGISRKAV